MVTSTTCSLHVCAESVFARLLAGAVSVANTLLGHTHSKIADRAAVKQCCQQPSWFVYVPEAVIMLCTTRQSLRGGHSSCVN